IIKYNGNTVSAKNYSIGYKKNKNVDDTATATISWKGSLKGTAKTEITYTVGKCDFTTGNITAKSVSDVFTNGKSTIKKSDLEKSKVVLVNVKKTLAKNRDYRLVYKYQVIDSTAAAAEGTDTPKYKEETYDPQNKAEGSQTITIPEETGLDVTVYAIPVGSSYKENTDGIQVAEFRVAYYNIAQAKLQLIDKTTKKATPIYFVDDTETKRANLGALNRLNNKTKNANSTAPYWLVVSHSKANGELEFSNFENKGNTAKQKDYTYDYENTATTVAGKQSVTIYGTGKFGGTKVFKYTLVKKTYDLKKAIVDTKIDPITISETTDANTAIKDALEGKITINGKQLDKAYYSVSYDASKLQAGKALKVTITGAVDDKGIQAYSGFKTISVKIASVSTPPQEEESSQASSEAPSEAPSEVPSEVPSETSSEAPSETSSTDAAA
ncbi:MAG: hypothetical protein K2N89_03035, partial [Lachnospiraceae bacterium]|nr:hypothetical protein [Lachnospiraceae bacterium]